MLFDVMMLTFCACLPDPKTMMSLYVIGWVLTNRKDLV